MAGNTTPDNITYPTGGDKVKDINTQLAAMASSMQAAITNRFNGAGVWKTYATKALMDAAPGTVVGQHASVNADTTAVNNGDYVWSGSKWVQSRINTSTQPFAMAAGQGSNSAAAYTTVTFPAGRFTVPPIVTGSTRGGSAAIFNVGTVTTTTATMAGFSPSSSAVPSSWFWQAVQMTPTSAAG